MANSKMDAHEVVGSESFATVGTFPRTVGKAILNARFAENVATGLKHGVLHLVLADLALHKSLKMS